MPTLNNEITIKAPIEKVWKALSNVEELEHYDPTVRKSIPQSPHHSGVGASRKVEMQDGKNWFEEKITDSIPLQSLTYELTACSFPVEELKHSYSFEERGDETRVIQKMNYRIKYGLFGKLMDTLMIRKQYNKGIKAFFGGLKGYVEGR